jgi:hypothetical protein
MRRAILLLGLAMVVACDSAPSGASGRSLISFSLCGGTQALTIFATNPDFIDEARRVAGADKSRIPVFDLLDGAGPDPQWTWHVNEATPTFADTAIELCDGCPRDVEGDKAYWLQTVKRFCPWSAAVSAIIDVP